MTASTITTCEMGVSGGHEVRHLGKKDDFLLAHGRSRGSGQDKA